MTSVFTYTGQQVDPESPDPAQFRIEDIAHALARQPAHLGHTVAFYSKAQRAVILSSLLIEPGAQWAALLWYATHAYDVTGPALCSSHPLARCIREVFRVTDPHPAAIVNAEERLAACERIQLFRVINVPLPADRIKMVPVSVSEAEGMFLARYADLVEAGNLDRTPKPRVG